LLLAGLGLALLGLFVAARLLFALQSEVDIRAFRVQQRSPVTLVEHDVAAVQRARDASRSGAAEEPPTPIAPPNETLWSQSRSRAHRAASADPAAARRVEGLLRVPAVGLEVPVYDGTDELALNRGAGRVEGTPPLGSGGNVGIAAHRDGFFRQLKDIAVGDAVLVDLLNATLRYEVTEIRVVEPEDTWVLAPTQESVLTLITCYPFYFVGAAPKRFVASALLVSREG
jgi:sortase A